MVQIVRVIAERLATRLGLPRIVRIRRSRQALVLAYHNVVPPDGQVVGDPSLHLSWKAFTRQIASLEDTHRIVPLASLLTESRDDRDRPRIAITFDDAYTGCVLHALPHLAARGHPATVFVAPGCLATSGFWWDLLAEAEGAGLDSGVRDEILASTAGRRREVEVWIQRHGRTLPDLPSHARPCNAEQLAAAVTLPGIRVSAHSWSHADLPRLDDETLLWELRNPLTWLRSRFPARVDAWIAYPYGRSDPRVRTMAEHVGYEAGFEISGGWIGEEGPADPYSVARQNIPAGVSQEGFELRVSGLFGG